MASAATAAPVRGVRYTSVAIALHWVIAIALLAMLTMGLVMAHAPLAPIDKFKLYQLHKSVGLSILALAVLRLLWRLVRPAPRLPDTMPAWEKGAAGGTHVLLYALMIGMPIVGWSLVSVSPLNIPTLYFGVVRIPDLGFLTAWGSKPVLEPLFKTIHASGAYVLIGLILLHAGAALRHYLVLHDEILQRMIPGLPRIGTSPPQDRTR